MNELRKTIREIKEKEGIVSVGERKYRIFRKGFDWEQLYSEKYCIPKWRY